MRTLAEKIAFVLLIQTLPIISEDKLSYQSIKRDFLKYFFGTSHLT